MAYIDSNVFIYPVLYNPDLNERAKVTREFLLKIENGEMKAYTSSLTWDEVVYVISRTLNFDDGINQGKKLLAFPNLEFLAVDKIILNSAQALLDKYHLRPRDSIHVASALNRNLKTVISDNEELDRVKEITRIPLLN